jgi:ABC-2 type transport system permease protein
MSGERTNTTGLGAAVTVEGRKLLAARVPLFTALLLLVGVTAICISTTVAAATGSAATVAKLGPIVAAGGWPGYLNAALQVTAAGSAGACGILLSWTFGREFSEGTITGLFALPVSRSAVAGAKLIAYAAWSIVVAVGMTIALLAGGLLAGLGALDPSDLSVAARLPLLAVLSASVVIPVAWVATLSRGLLGGIAATIALVVSAQVLVFSGAGSWYPPAAPALWALDPSAPHALAVAVSCAVPLAFAALTLTAWQRLQLTR